MAMTGWEGEANWRNLGFVLNWAGERGGIKWRIIGRGDDLNIDHLLTRRIAQEWWVVKYDGAEYYRRENAFRWSEVVE